MFDPCVDLGIDFVECALERAIDEVETRNCGGETRAQEAIVEADEEQSGAEAEAGDTISEAVRQAFDQAVQAQAAQLVSNGARGDRL